MKGLKAFFKRKDIEISGKRYLQDALSAMALGLFASLLIGLIIKTIGEQTNILMGENGNAIISFVANSLIDIGTMAMGLMGSAIGVAVAWGLKAPPLVLFASVVTGSAGAALGGPAGAFIAAAVGAEFGKMVSKETKVDIITTPAVTIIAGYTTGALAGPLVSSLMTGLGNIIVNATELQPFLFGIIISVIVGLALTAPISSAALCIMLDLSGLAAGAATAGCCAQMIGFAAISYKANGFGGIVAQGLGTSMLQVSNIMKNPWILLPPTIAAAITGPIATVIFKMENVAAGAGMGTSGLVGQIGTFTAMGFSVTVFVKILIVHILLPAVFAVAVNKLMKLIKLVKDEDYKLDI